MKLGNLGKIWRTGKCGAVILVAAGLTTNLMAGNGKGKPLDVDNLPKSVLKSQLDKLPPAARDKAKKAMEKMQLRDNDLASLRVGKRGDLHAECSFELHAPRHKTEEPSGPPPESREALAPLSETFKLHSRPGCSKVLYLDFDGHTTSRTQWNESYNIRSIKSAPINMDNDPRSFSDAERLYIQHVWQRVVEDFIIFDIDVTTEDPGSKAMAKPFYQRIVISPSKFTRGGGVSFLNSWSWSSDTPSFCFVVGNDRNTGKVCSHELGHTLRLWHAGGVNSEYYSGHRGGGTLPWAPIMGMMYDTPVCTWTKGEFVNSNPYQRDEIADLAQRIGPYSGTVGLLPDDHGNNVSESTQMVSDDGSFFTVEGMINDRNDLDVFEITAMEGSIDIVANPYSGGSGVAGANLDIQITLYDAAGNVVASAAPPGNLEAALSVDVTAGQYYIEIDGVGDGQPMLDPPCGYTDYGSLGRYTIDVLLNY